MVLGGYSPGVGAGGGGGYMASFAFLPLFRVSRTFTPFPPSLLATVSRAVLLEDARKEMS